MPPTAAAPPVPPAPPVSIVAYRDGGKVVTGDFLYCDTPKQVVLVTPDPQGLRVWPGAIVTVARSGAVHAGTIAGPGKCHDDCDGPYGGHAGCSEIGWCTTRTSVRGASRLTTTIYVNGRYDSIDAVGGAACDAHESFAIGACSTAKHRAIIVDTDDTDPVSGAEIYRLDLRTGKKLRSFEGALDTSDPQRWTFDFHEGGDRVDVAYTLDPTPSAALRIGGKTETCLAFGLEHAAP